MDYSTKIAQVLKCLEYDLTEIKTYAETLHQVIELFELSRKEKLNPLDVEVLRIIALRIGVPSLYRMIEKAQSSDYKFQITLENLSSIYNESVYYIYKDFMLHRYQIEFLNKMGSTDNFRVFLTAPTSFGKTLLMKELIRLKDYNKVLFILPSIALISENVADFFKTKRYSEINTKYDFVTLIDEDDKEYYESNAKIIFLLTMERFIALTHFATITFDFTFIDEVYKIDESLSNEETNKSTEDGVKHYDIGREISYRYGLNDILKNSRNIALAGPYLNIENESTKSFVVFLDANHFQRIDYNIIEIVNKENFDCEVESKSKNNSVFVDGEEVILDSHKKTGKFLQLVDFLLNKNESTLVYVSSIKMANNYSKLLNEKYEEIKQSTRMANFISHLKDKYHSEWRLINALSRGFGFHHGRLPKYIQKEIISLYNLGEIKVLITTTTIIEGVNTIAKNMIILSSKKGFNDLNKFDALNIIGRTGRFTKHFVGRCFFMDSNFNKILHGEDNVLKHAMYAIDEKKTSTDLFVANEQYLSEDEKIQKSEIIQKIDAYELNAEKLFSINPDVDMKLKIDILDLIYNNYDQLRKILNNLTLNISKRYVDPKYMDDFILFFKSILSNIGLGRYLFKLRQTTFLSFKMNQYMINGLQGMIQNYIEYISKEDSVSPSSKKVNEIIDNDLRMVSNVFRFEIPRFFGLIERINCLVNVEIYPDIDSKSIASLIELLEYEADTKRGKKVYDFGASRNIVKAFDGKEVKLDPYEVELKKDIEEVLFGDQ